MSMDSGGENNIADGSIQEVTGPLKQTEGPSVHVSYKGLTRDSRKKLEQMMSLWAGWQAEQDDGKEEMLEDGTETYFPPLKMATRDNSFQVHFWIDKPSKRARVMEDEVPLYDRGIDGILIPQDEALLAEGNLELQEEAARCFNCGSYSHAMRDCSKPKNTAAINSARKVHQARRGSGAGGASNRRYYEQSSGGRFDDIKPGVLGTATRQCLGIGENDPPPWLNRMREIGYPPGYIDYKGDDGGIVVFDESTTEDGEIVDCGEKPPPAMSVEFPGLNAPIPENADRRLWSPKSETRESRFLKRSFSSSGRLGASSYSHPDESLRPPGEDGSTSSRQTRM